MDKQRKKELTAQYKQTRPDMGIFAIRSKADGKCHLQTAQDIRAVIESTKAKLRYGMHPVRELQQAWTERGADNFTIELLEHLKYDKDEAKTDYKEDLALLQLIWEEKLAKDNIELYKKKI